MPDGSVIKPDTTPKNKGGRPPGADLRERREQARKDAAAFDAWCARWRRLEPPARPNFEQAPRVVSPGAREALRCGWQ